ncbi:MAG: hypothetical protein LAO31_08160 [Acidobacteriia bacterium]|nr:hypothetical protein [Terriglobia bacterium]
MSDHDQNNKESQPGNRREFLRRFLKKGAPLIVGAVTKPLTNLPGVTPPKFAPDAESPAVRAAVEAEHISEELKKEFERTHEEFIQNNPDFLEKP